MAKVILFNRKVVTHIIASGEKRPLVYNNTTPPPEPIILPSDTIRFRFENLEYNPSVIKNGGTWTKVTDSSFNDWDWFCDTEDYDVYGAVTWENVFYKKFTEDNKVQIIATGDVSNVSKVWWMFEECTGLTSISPNAFSTLSTGDNMFSKCTGLTSIAPNAFPSLSSGVFMFEKCTGLTSISSTAFPNLTYAPWMFFRCTNLTQIDNLFSDVNYAGNMFDGCTGLQRIPENIFSNPSLSYVAELFKDCVNVQSGALALYNKFVANPNIISKRATFENCGIDTETGLAELQQIPKSWGGLAES